MTLPSVGVTCMEWRVQNVTSNIIRGYVNISQRVNKYFLNMLMERGQQHKYWVWDLRVLVMFENVLSTFWKIIPFTELYFFFLKGAMFNVQKI